MMCRDQKRGGAVRRAQRAHRLEGTMEAAIRYLLS